VASQKIGVPQFQQQAKDVSSQYFSEVMDNYKINKRYLNSVEFAQKSNETMAKLMNIAGQDESLRKDLEFQRNKSEDFGFKDNLDQVLIKGTQNDFNQYMSNIGGYSTGKGLIQKYNEADFLNSVTKLAPTVSKETYVGTKGGMDTFRTDKVRDDNYLTQRATEYLQSHPAALDHFGGDVNKAVAAIPKLVEAGTDIKYKPTGGVGKTSYELDTKYRFSNIGSPDRVIVRDRTSKMTYSKDSSQNNPFVQIGYIDPSASSNTKPIRLVIPEIADKKGAGVYQIYDLNTGEIASTSHKQTKDKKGNVVDIPSIIIGSDNNLSSMGGIKPNSANYILDGFGYVNLKNPKTGDSEKMLVVSVNVKGMPNKRYAIPLTQQNSATVSKETGFSAEDMIKAFETNDFSQLPEVNLDSFQK
jgi:hypothetical protein